MYDTAVLATLPDPFTSLEAIEAGLTRHVLERLARNGDISRTRRGVFRVRLPAPAGERWEQVRREHLARARVALRAHPHHALSHGTAAVAAGWPVLLHPDSLVHLTAVRVEPRSRRIADRVLHHSDSILNDTTLIDGLPSLTAERIVADCLRTMALAAGVAVADAALRDRSTTPAAVQRLIALQRRWRGRPRAVAALLLADHRRETWLESFSFVTLHELGIELPVPQVEVFDERRRFVARVDGLWIADGTVAEADGQGKYLLAEPGGSGPTGRSAADKVVAERRREKRLERLGLEVVRWDSADIRHEAEAVAAAVWTARRAGDIRRFRGWLMVDGVWLDLTGHRLSREKSSVEGRFAG